MTPKLLAGIKKPGIMYTGGRSAVAGAIAAIGEAHVAGRTDNSRLLWQLLMLDKSLVKLGLIA